jgi:transcription elongation factor Elf1
VGPEAVEAFFTCPFCGETISMIVETSAQIQEYIEDCEVCCRPIEITVHCQGHELQSIHAERGD